MSGRKVDQKVREVTIQQLRQDPGRWIRRAAEGETMIIVAGRTRVPVAQLTRYLPRGDSGEEEQGEEQEETGPGG